MQRHFWQHNARCNAAHDIIILSLIVKGKSQVSRYVAYVAVTRQTLFTFLNQLLFVLHSFICRMGKTKLNPACSASMQNLNKKKHEKTEAAVSVRLCNKKLPQLIPNLDWVEFSFKHIWGKWTKLQGSKSGDTTPQVLDSLETNLQPSGRRRLPDVCQKKECYLNILQVVVVTTTA